MKRAGALLGVVVMVAAAFLVRSAITDDDTGDGSAGPSSGPRLLCATDLAEICQVPGNEVVARPAGTTADALLAADDAAALDADAWIVTAAWADLVVAERARLGAAPLFEIDGAPLASAGIVLAVWADRDAELATRCDDVDWRCVAEQDGTPLATGDRVNAASPSAEGAAGLTIAAAQMASLVGRADFAANDFDGAVLSLADRLAGGQLDDPLRTMRSRGPGQVTAAGTLAPLAVNLSSNFGAIVTRSIEGIRADVVVIVPRGRSLDSDTRDAVVAALRDAGWDDPPSPDDGLPDGSVLAAVRTIWNDAA